jgi:ABC-type lipoprotein release transport system permease subunit
MLPGVGTSDVATYAGVLSAMLLMALVAAAIPALRIARIDPASALRQE